MKPIATLRTGKWIPRCSLLMIFLILSTMTLFYSCSNESNVTSEVEDALRDHRISFNGKDLNFQEQMLYLILALNIYRTHVGEYPSQVNNLDALLAKPEVLEGEGEWQGPYVDSDIFFLDPWGNRLRYTVQEEGIMDLRSLGPDGVLSKDDLTAMEMFPDVWREMEKLPQMGQIPIESVTDVPSATEVEQLNMEPSSPEQNQ